jgi:ankyrin repeat protein
MAPATSIASSDHDERLEPQILRAAESDNVERLREIIASARKNGQLSDNFLHIALMRSSEKGTISATECLLEEGAPPDSVPWSNRPSPLLRAVKRDQITIVKLLLKHGATLETKDKNGRTALMTAALKNNYYILLLLLFNGADVNARDNRGRNVLHNLGADKQCNLGEQVIDLLLQQDIAIDGEEGQDELKRTPLHWACATGKMRLAEMLLERPKLQSANINAVEIREKTSLHIAAAHDRDDMVEMLLRHGANIHAKSDGGWTPLHNACEKGTEQIVRILLAAGADINAKLLNGMSPLHVAAQHGHMDVVRCLVDRKDIKMAVKDAFGSTPFLCAARNKRKDIVELLAPFNHVEMLSEEALGACNGFNATIVDFGNFHNGNRVRKKTVYELLYAQDSVNPRKPESTILPQDPKVINFRWIHLPANNMAWVETLLAKWFIEDGVHDVEGFKALERSFSHQHRGQQPHSHFMRPLCQSTPRAAPPLRIPDDNSTLVEQGPRIIVINGGLSSKDDNIPKTPLRNSPSAEDQKERSKPSSHGKDHAKGEQKENKEPNPKGAKGPKTGTYTPDKNHQRKLSHPLDSRRGQSPGSPGRKDATKVSRGNIFAFMPFLHFETHCRRKEMQEAIELAESLKSQSRPCISRAKTYDEMLIRAHLTTSPVSLHVRRTLDQSFYHNIDIQSHDTDQVVYRYQKRGKPEDPDNDHKIFMVDQLWMWILGKDLIVTSFPQRWQQPKNDPLNVLDSIIEDINSKTRDPVTSVHDLSMIIAACCSGVFDRHKMGNDDYQFLDMFEAFISSANDRETHLFKEFNEASAQASAWLQYRRRHHCFSVLHSNDSAKRKGTEEKFKFGVSRGPLFVDKLLDIGQETDLLAETKDIRDKLDMIKKVLEDQTLVVPDLESSICEIYAESQTSQKEVKKRFKEQLKTIEMHIKDIDRMDKQAERIYNSITDMLDLKQKHANAFEARFARTARQRQTIMVFAILTIILLPISFIAAVSIPLTFIALSFDEISDAWVENSDSEYSPASLGSFAGSTNAGPISSLSVIAPIARDSVAEIVSLILNDAQLRELLNQAFRLLDPKKVTRNFKRALSLFSQELMLEALTPAQKQAAKFVGHKSRQISILIQEKLRPSRHLELPSQRVDNATEERQQRFLTNFQPLSLPADEESDDDASDPDDNIDPDLHPDLTNLRTWFASGNSIQNLRDRFCLFLYPEKEDIVKNANSKGATEGLVQDSLHPPQALAEQKNSRVKTVIKERDKEDTDDLFVELPSNHLRNRHYKAFSILSLLWGLWDRKKPLGPGYIRLKWTCVRSLQRNPPFTPFPLFFLLHTTLLTIFRTVGTLPITTF